MKLISFLFCLCVIFAFSIHNSKIAIKAEKVENANKTFVKTTLTNKTNDTLYYYTMTCSWQEFYSTNNKNVQININDCDKNIPKIQKIAPHKNHIVTLEIIKKVVEKKSSQKLRIGFNFIEAKSANSLDLNIKDLKKKTNEIWSNEISI